MPSKSFFLLAALAVLYYLHKTHPEYFQRLLQPKEEQPAKKSTDTATTKATTTTTTTTTTTSTSASSSSPSAAPTPVTATPVTAPVTIVKEPLKMSASVFSIEGKALKLDTKDDVAKYVEEIGQLENLKEIKLNGNTIAVEAAEELANAFAKHTTIEKAILCDIFTARKKDVIPAALKALCTALENQTNLLELDVSDNAFGPIGVPSLAPLLISSKTLQVLRVNNNGLGPEGGCLLADALQTSLDERVAAGLKPTLKTLICGRNRLENKTATALSKVLPGYSSLREIRLLQNGIRPEGVLVLTDALKTLVDLEWIDFEDNTLTAKAGLPFAEALPSWTKLKKLNLGDCLLGNKTVVAIAEKLKDNFADLEYLNLCFAEAKNDAFLKLADALGNKPKLANLELNGNTIHAETEQALKDALEAIGQPNALGSLEDNNLDDDDDDEFEDAEDTVGDAQDDE